MIFLYKIRTRIFIEKQDNAEVLTPAGDKVTIPAIAPELIVPKFIIWISVAAILRRITALALPVTVMA